MCVCEVLSVFTVKYVGRFIFFGSFAEWKKKKKKKDKVKFSDIVRALANMLTEWGNHAGKRLQTRSEAGSPGQLELPFRRIFS